MVVATGATSMSSESTEDGDPEEDTDDELGAGEGALAFDFFDVAAMVVVAVGREAFAVTEILTFLGRFPTVEYVLSLTT